MTTHARHQHQLGRPLEFRTVFRQSLGQRAWRFFNPAVAKPLLVIFVAVALSIMYWIALINARHQYRDLRARFCAHLVTEFHLRNPKLRQISLVDSCIEWEQLSGEVIR